MNIVPISESAVVCSLPPPASIQQQRQLWALARQLQSEQDIVEVVLGMNNLTVFTDFFVDFKPLVQRLEQLWAELKVSDFQGRHIEIPVIYGGERGQDLSDVAKFHQTTPERIIQMHSEPIYTVYMIGFQAGFPYLGGLPENLHTPRRATPRTLVPAGSVGIGGVQTGIYPFSSPGGWQLIGYTKQALFDKNQAQPTLLQAGDTVKFIVEGIEL
ncbi:TPA: 5-oxoprolinase subunit PxpB [Haemophilus influenzae]|uniref:5-oxoprolinase subunit PxpB n=1 Tax=Haemophilus influenzae TaxID=727 RepID=UPI000DD46DBF|nr:5-oxoprolinase subunit PxpB [Haemophilus influenzae]MCK8815062.1 5-oxoprolinase subunit PxpB [Haemophilus influenzae]MCK9666279.1 5-oxoprolinase subunit PxpB [Haemophilus influenzae]MDO7260442.1 5-oxoprolinase subunit PxpB [Haemophilus influenzae]RFN75481.1 5-oxoprolinase subunit PxpB [Haemophilus influenzae]RFO06270.1 5-oxoprolinase subunit PxpB [Haemophilus influenzae]